VADAEADWSDGDDADAWEDDDKADG